MTETDSGISYCHHSVEYTYKIEVNKQTKKSIYGSQEATQSVLVHKLIVTF